jgi:ABC-type transport system substrate-binding protein
MAMLRAGSADVIESGGEYVDELRKVGMRTLVMPNAGVHLLVEHPKLDAFIERLATEPNPAERTRIMREEMGPWLYEYMPAVSIGATHSIAGVGPKVGDWPLIPGHMGVHNWEYVTRAAR